MLSEQFKTIIEPLKQAGEMNFHDGATDEEISAFETNNNIKLPAKYKEWLMFSDGGELFLPAGIQFYGVAHKPVIDVDYDDRPDDNYIVIGALAAGDPLLSEKASERICIYNHEAGKIEDDESYEDFSCFLKDLSSILGIGG